MPWLKSTTLFRSLNFAPNSNPSSRITKLAELIKRLAPPIEEVKTAINNSAYRGRIMMFIVRSYEEGMRGDVQIDDVQYEHIMPVTGQVKTSHLWAG